MADNGSCSRLDFFNARDVSARDPAGILLSHVQVFFGELAGRSHGPAGWIIKRGPWIGAPENEVGQKQAGDRAMRHPHSRIAGRDEDVVGIHRITPNERYAVHRFHHLTRPAKFDFAQHGKTLSSPSFQPSMAFRGIVRLPGLVIFAANNEQLHGHVVGCRETDVMVGVAGIPIKRFRQDAGRNVSSNRIADIGCLLGVDGDPIIDRSISGDHHCIRGNDRSVSSFDSCRRTTLNSLDSGIGKYRTALSLDRASHGG